jgi:hypothetical protein
VHRIQNIQNGIITRGDWNRSADAWVLEAANVLYRIDYISRGNRRIRIYGGRIGLLTGLAARYSLKVMMLLSLCFRPVQHWFSGMLWKFLPEKYRPRVYAFQSPHGEEMQLLMGKRLIGWKRPGERWYVKQRYRVFVRDADISFPDQMESE